MFKTKAWCRLAPQLNFISLLFLFLHLFLSKFDVGRLMFDVHLFLRFGAWCLAFTR